MKLRRNRREDITPAGENLARHNQRERGFLEKERIFHHPIYNPPLAGISKGRVINLGVKNCLFQGLVAAMRRSPDLMPAGFSDCNCHF